MSDIAPPGSRLVQALARVCRDHLLREKRLVAPSLRVGHQWIEAAVRSGQPAVNVRVQTLAGLAIELAGGRLPNDSRLVSPRGGALLIDRAIHQLRAESGRSYLAGLQPSHGLSQSLHRSLSDLLQAGLDGPDLRVEHFEDANKGRELTVLLERYQNSLRACRHVDPAEVIRAAMAALRGGDGPLDMVVLIPDDLECTALERRLLDMLPASSRIELPVDEPARANEDQPNTDLDRLRWLLHPREAPPLYGDDTVRIVRAVGEMNEVREVLRRCLAEGIRFDEVELLHTDAATYVPMIYELFCRLWPNGSSSDELPVTFAEGLPARYARPGQALVAWLEWMADDFPQTGLARMLQQGLLNIPDDAAAGPGFGRLAAVLRGIPIGFGQERYLPTLDDYAAGLDAQLARPDLPDEEEAWRDGLRQRRQAVAILRRLAEALLDKIPAVDARPCDVLEAAIDFLEKRPRTVTEIDRNARGRLLAEMRDLQYWIGLADGPVSLDVREWLTALPAEVQVLGSGPRPGRMHVAHVATGGHSGRAHTFIIGLDDGRFPGSGLQDPLLLDRERGQLSRYLPTAARRVGETRHAFARLLGRLRGRLTLSFPCLDLHDGRELFPSSILLAAYRILSGNLEADQSAMLSALEPPASFAPDREERCLDESEWWMWRLCDGQAGDKAMEIVLRRYPHLARGREAAAHRASHAFTVFDGRVPQAGQDLDPTRADGPVLSGSRLEMLGRCPRAFFFRHALGIAPPLELVIDPNCWLDRFSFGRLLHEVFERFYRTLAERSEVPDYERHRPLIQEILHERATEYRRCYPPPSEAVYRAQYRQADEAVRFFLAEEADYCKQHGNRPLFLEVSVGMPDTPSAATPLDSTDPVTLHLPGGRVLRLRGRIDRIDELAPNRFAVWDYKTGGASKYNQKDPFREGRTLQAILYMAMARQRLHEQFGPKAKVEQFGFFFPTPWGKGERRVWSQEELEAGNAVLECLSELARTGSFPATDTDDDCKTCDYPAVCRRLSETTASSARKMDGPDQAMLQPFITLRRHE